MSNPNTPKKSASKRRKRNIKFALAAVGVVGVGAALTTAAWTDQVWFAADTSAASVDLQGSITGDADDWFDIYGGTDTSAANPIEIVPSEFENLLPESVREVTVHLRNAGSVPMTLADPAAYAFTGDFLDPLAGPELVIDDTFGSTTLAPGDETTLTVEIIVPDDWDVSNIGKTGGLLITVEGTAIEPAP